MTRNLIFAFVYFLAIMSAAQATTKPRVSQGTVDFSQWSFENRNFVYLSGNWNFQWGELLEIDDINSSNPLQFQVPGSWNSVRDKDESRHFGPGVATIWTKITGLESGKNYGIQSSTFMSPHHVRIYSKTDNEFRLMAEAKSGVVSTNIDAIQYDMEKHVYSFFGSPEVYILVHMAASTKLGGVFLSPFNLGYFEDIRFDTRLTDFRLYFLFGIYFLLIVYSFSIYLQRKNDKSSLFIGLFSLAQLMRFGQTEFIRDRFFDPLLLPMFILAVFSVGVIALGWLPYLVIRSFETTFLQMNLPRIRKLTFYFAITMILATGALQIIEYGLVVFFALINVGAIVFTLVAAFLVYKSWPFIRKKETGAKLYSIGISLLFISLVYDNIGVFTGISIYFNHWAVALFAVFQTMIIGRRFADTYETNETLYKELKIKEAERTAMFHNTSHELRTPLNGIIGFVDLIRKGQYGEIYDPLKSQMAKIHNLALGLKQQVNTILDLARSKKGQLSLNLQSFDLSYLAQDLSNLAEGLALRYKTVDFDITVENKDESQIVVCDFDKVYTICRNLLGNAFKFKPPGRRHQVSMKLYLNSTQEVIIECQDTGIGIPRNDFEKIFDEFSQVESDARRSYEGSGLGLSMVRDYLKLMGGKIDLDSVEGKGTKFTVTIPSQSLDSANGSIAALSEKSIASSDVVIPSSVSNRTDASKPAKTEKIAEQSSTSALDRRTKIMHNPGQYLIQVIDDNELNCELVDTILKAEGYQTQVATGGKQGLSQMQESIPDIVLLDLMMPEFSGEDVLEHLKLEDSLRRVPVIVLTARATEGDRILGLELGADDYLAKPLIAQELLLRIKNILQRIENSRIIEGYAQREKLTIVGELLQEFSRGQESQKEPLKAEAFSAYVQKIVSNFGAETTDQKLISANLPQSANQAIDILQPILSFNQITVDNQIPELEVAIEPVDLKIVLCNLIRQAAQHVDAMDPSDAREIAITAYEEDRSIHLKLSLKIQGEVLNTKDFKTELNSLNLFLSKRSSFAHQCKVSNQATNDQLDYLVDLKKAG